MVIDIWKGREVIWQNRDTQRLASVGLCPRSINRFVLEIARLHPESGSSRLEIGVGVVMQGPLRKPLPQRPQLLSRQLRIELRKRGCLLLEITAELRVCIELSPDLIVIVDPAEPF